MPYFQVSQSYFGHPGTLVDQDKDNAGAAWQIWAKPQASGAKAVLLINMGSSAADLGLVLSNFVKTTAGSVRVRDLWARKDLGLRKGALRFPGVGVHDSVFLLLTPEQGRAL